MIDLVPLLDQPTAIVGATGTGKTFAAKGAVETLLSEGRRVCIIDPTGAYWGLRAGADGDEANGFPVTIFGGEHADVEIAPDGETGKALAMALADRDFQVIIDISEMTNGQKNRFLTPFLEHLYAKNKAALHIIVDEADEVAAQRLADGEQRLFGIFDKIVRRGRIKGFRPLMITQRPAVIHKNVLSQIKTLIALGLTSPQDRKAIDDWVKGNADVDQAKTVRESLPILQRGEGWVWSPMHNVLERVTFPPIATFDSSRTPEVGEVITAPALKSVDMDALRDTMASIAEAKDEKPSTPSTAKPDPNYARDHAAEIEKAEKRGYDRGYDEGFRVGKNLGGRQAAHSQMLRVVDTLRGAAMLNGDGAALDAAYERMKAIAIEADTERGRAADEEPLPASTKPAAATKSEPEPVLSTSDVELSPSAKKIIRAVQAAYPIGISLQVAAKRAGISSRSSAYRKYLSQAASSQAIGDRGDGRFVANATMLPDGPIQVAGIESFKAKLPPSYAKMLTAIEEAAGAELTKEMIAERAEVSPTSSGLTSGLRELVALDLIERTDAGFRLSPDLL